MNIFSPISKFKKIILKMKYRNYFIVNLDGKKIQTKENAVSALANIFNINFLPIVDLPINIINLFL